MHTNYGMTKKTLKNFCFYIPVYFTSGRWRFYPGKSLLQHYIFPWKLQQKYHWKNKEQQWSSDENSAVYSNIKYVLKRQRKMQLLIITYHKGNSEPGCHQWQCSHFSHLRLQLQILPVKMKEKMFTTLISTEIPQWQVCRYKTHCLFHLVEVPTRFDDCMEYLLLNAFQLHTIHIHDLLWICCLWHTRKACLLPQLTAYCFHSAKHTNMIQFWKNCHYFQTGSTSQHTTDQPILTKFILVRGHSIVHVLL